jgi:hypothetical protein
MFFLTPRTGAKTRKNRVKNRLSARNSHAIQRKKLLRWVILDGLCAQGATFLAAFAQNGVVRVVYPSVQGNHAGEPLRRGATAGADIPGPVATLEAILCSPAQRRSAPTLSPERKRQDGARNPVGMARPIPPKRSLDGAPLTGLRAFPGPRIGTWGTLHLVHAVSRASAWVFRG